MRRLGALAAALWLGACSVVDFARPGATGAEPEYAAIYPWYAEFCALSQIRKKPGFGAEIRGQVGGHAVFYLQGACRAATGDRQRLLPCDASDAEPAEGVGLSMNEHFSNAKWVAIPGRDFFYDGGLRPEETVTRDRYRQTQAAAQRLGLYDGVDFHPRVFAEMPPGASPEAYKYEVSVATDYAIGFGRGRYCARLPVTRPQLLAMIGFLNAENEPYRSGREEFRWSLFQDNCIHLAHNALAAAGFWREWPTHRPLLVSILDFPVPKNEFVNLLRRANDPALLEPAAAFADPAARDSVLRFGQLPVRPGAIALSWPARQPNEVYETELKLVFYDEPLIGRYRGWLEAILADPRNTDLDTNLRDFADRYRQLRAARPPLAEWLAQTARQGADPGLAAAFHTRFYTAVDREMATIGTHLARLEHGRALADAAPGLPASAR